MRIALPQLMRRKNRRRGGEHRLALPAIAWGRYASLALVAAALGAGVLALGWLLNRPVRSVTVAGPFQRVSALDVEKVVRQRLDGGFITANLDGLQRAVEQLAWVDRARIQRRWPDGVYVQVTEQVAAARWGDSGLINTRGELFLVDQRHMPDELPLLSGPPGSEPQVADVYFQLYPRLLEAGLRATALGQDARGAWVLDLANGVVVRFGRRQLEERVERFFKAGAAVIAARPNDIAVLDMRYSNGFAVGWRTQGEPVLQPATSPGQDVKKERDNDV